MIKAYTIKARKRPNSAEIPEKDLVEWGWKFTGKNISQRALYLCVTYILEDRDKFKISSVFKQSDAIGPGETITFQRTETLDHTDLERVYTSSLWYSPLSRQWGVPYYLE